MSSSIHCEEVEAWREESRRKDTIIAQMNQTIAALTERIPELEPAREAPPEPRESPESTGEGAGKGDASPERRSGAPGGAGCLGNKAVDSAHG